MSFPSRRGLPAAAPCAWIVMFAAAGCSLTPDGANALPQRMVFLGDSITDGFTYPLLFRQSLTDAGRTAPTCINAGVASDTAADMLRRLDRDVLPHRPGLVAVSAGINDVLRNVSLKDYAANMRAILERMKREKVDVLILTTTVLGPKHAAASKRLEGYNATLRRFAKEFGHPLAEVNGAMHAARAKGPKLLEADNVHLAYEGYRVMTRAVLDGLGCRDVPVPKTMRVEPLKGLIRSWKLKGVKGGKALDEKAVAAIRPDETWKPLALPEAGPQTHWWADQIRKRGYALSVAKVAGKAKRYVGFATISAKGRKRAYFNTGAQLEAIWLNGKLLWRSKGWTGYHAGKERLAASLKAGSNTVIIETGGQFFLSVTDSNQW